MRYSTFECSPSVTKLFEHVISLPGAILLEDIPGQTAIITAEPDFVLTSKDGVTIRSDGAVFSDDPLNVLEEQLLRFRQDVPLDAIPFAGGAVGYFSYDLGRSIEHMPRQAVEDVPTPDYCLGFYDSALHVDLSKKICTALSWSGDSRLVEYWHSLAMQTPPDSGTTEIKPVLYSCLDDNIISNFTREEYIYAIKRIQDYITAGDVYQVNLTQRFQSKLACYPWELYKMLRKINPAPKSCYIQLGGLTLASASPELFLKYDPITPKKTSMCGRQTNGSHPDAFLIETSRRPLLGARKIVTKPIKGTRPRADKDKDDARLAEELAMSEKDRAENLMIVDMQRNDLGKVAKYGSVHVSKLWEIESHPNVFQMVSTVEAELADEFGPVDILRAAFPGGSITGAPKVRAMEIIEELEPCTRGIYTGSAGFIDYTGRMDLSIVIRSFIIHGSTAYFHAGGGIVYDSNPIDEYQETLDKISGLLAALKCCEVKI